MFTQDRGNHLASVTLMLMPAWLMGELAGQGVGTCVPGMGQPRAEVDAQSCPTRCAVPFGSADSDKGICTS